MDTRDYLMSYGTLGDFGRFRPSAPLDLRRGDRAVVRTVRGLELGEVMRAVTARHTTVLSGTAVGDILRIATVEDERLANRLQDRTAELCDEANRLAAELGLPLLILDAEVLLDGEHAALHYVRRQDCDIRPLVGDLSRRFALTMLVQDLTREVVEEEEEHGCGSCGDGGCGSGGGGCSSGGCNTCGTVKAEDVQVYFASLREKMIARNRVALL